MKQRNTHLILAVMSGYKGYCAHCGVTRYHARFKARPAGRLFDVEKWLLEDEGGRRLRFFFDNCRNDRVCDTCFLRNSKLLRKETKRGRR